MVLNHRQRGSAALLTATPQVNLDGSNFDLQNRNPRIAGQKIRTVD